MGGRRCWMTKGRVVLCAILLAGLLAGRGGFIAHAGPLYGVVDDGIPIPLTDFAGDPLEGRQVAGSRSQGNCLACHTLPIPKERDHGQIGPDLGSVGARLSEAQLRLKVVNPKVTAPGTIMPAYYRTEGLNHVAPDKVGKTILSAQDVEDIVAYLMTLR